MKHRHFLYVQYISCMTAVDILGWFSSYKYQFCISLLELFHTQSSIKTVAEHLIFPYQQFAREKGKTLYCSANAKVHGQWDRENACKKDSISHKCETGMSSQGHGECSKRAKFTWPGAFTGLWQICKIVWENLRRKYVLLDQ